MPGAVETPHRQANDTDKGTPPAEGRSIDREIYFYRDGAQLGRLQKCTRWCTHETKLGIREMARHQTHRVSKYCSITNATEAHKMGGMQETETHTGVHARGKARHPGDGLVPERMQMDGWMDGWMDG